MNDNKAVMQMALDALERVDRVDSDCDILESSLCGAVIESIAALREAIAQPEQTAKPVAWQWLDTGTFRKTLPKTAVVADWHPLFKNSAAIAQPKDKP